MPVIRVGQGMITSVVFMDATGAVWPITAYTLGDPQAFNVTWDKAGGVLMIQGQKLYAQTNMGVQLEGMEIPVMLSLMIGQTQWDYLDYVRVTQSQLMEKGQIRAVAEAPAYLNDLLMGLPPKGSRALQVSGGSAQAWTYQGNYLLLTRATLLSPAWKSQMSAGGTDPYHAYVLPKSPVLMLSNQGEVQSVTVSEESDNA